MGIELPDRNGPIEHGPLTGARAAGASTFTGACCCRWKATPLVGGGRMFTGAETHRLYAGEDHPDWLS